MAVALNHTIIQAKDAEQSATFWAGILGLAPPQPFGPFMVIKTANAVSLDFRTTAEAIMSRHFAFLVSEGEFDAIFKRIIEGQVPYWADPGRIRPQQINHNDGGRGCYFTDPDGHFLEILTQPYGTVA